MKLCLFLVVTCLAGFNPSASALLIGADTVAGGNSLYASDWGHQYQGGSDGEFNALGKGNPARAFGVDGAAYGFSAGHALRISASGCVVDLGLECTGPGYDGGLYRGLHVYSLIGLWSSDAASIVALDLSDGNPAFFIGSLLELIVPDFSSSLYLFMATNDGDFSDNSGAYSVRIDSIGNAGISQVPAPSVIFLVALGLLLVRRFVPNKAVEAPFMALA